MKPLHCLIIVLLSFIASSTIAADRTILEWDFQKASDTLGWTTAEVLDKCGISENALTLSPKPGIPKLESPIFDIKATHRQYIEITLKTDSGGTGFLYYSNTSEEPYHGFRAGQMATYDFTADNKFHTYKIYPFWQKFGNITHIRLDPPGNNIQIKSIRIKEIEQAAPSPQTQWNFKNSSYNWIPLNDHTIAQTSQAGVILTGNRQSVYLSNIIDIAASDRQWLTIRMSSKTEHPVLFHWTNDTAEGLQSITIRAKGDGKVHSYAFNLFEYQPWAGHIYAIGITPTASDKPDSIVIESVTLADSPVGPAEISIKSLHLSESFVRAGQKTKLVAKIMNEGGETAKAISVSVDIPGLFEHPLPVKRIASLKSGETQTLMWDITAKSEKLYEATCRVLYDGTETFDSTQLRLNSALDKKTVKNLKYVPEPELVDTGNYSVGVYYFPGWFSYERWSVLNNYPERRPVLGYYREGDPEIADWQIYWALSHGIEFFIFDWYWADGARSLEYALHDGFMKSRYWDKMKFCLLWANHNPPGTHSEQDLLNVTKYWIDNYFKQPNYLKINGKNVIVMFSPWNLTNDMGSSAVKAAFDKMRKMCEDAGAGGLYLVACTYPDEARIKATITEGYDAVSGYNYPSAGNKNQQYSPYSWMVDAYKDWWSNIANLSQIPYIPVCEPGWDSRPWHGRNAQIRTGKTPQLWRKMLSNSKDFVDNPANLKPGNRKLVFLEAWNEYGEGDYIEPHAQFGFDYLEAIRQVFAPASKRPAPLVPQDIGLGPYELTSPEFKTHWDFSKSADRNWYTGNMTNPTYENGAMSARAVGIDPIFYGPAININAAKIKTIEIKMKMDKADFGEIFFSQPNVQMSQERSVKFSTIGDGSYHIYTVNMSVNPYWKGTIDKLRIDPNGIKGSKVSIAYIKLK